MRRNDPEHWRNEAKATRATAKVMQDGDTKCRLLAIANDYDPLAERAHGKREGDDA